MPVTEVELTDKQKVQAEKMGICPHCQKLMVKLSPPNAPNTAELYCEPCHYSFSLNSARPNI